MYEPSVLAAWPPCGGGVDLSWWTFFFSLVGMTQVLLLAFTSFFDWWFLVFYARLPLNGSLSPSELLCDGLWDSQEQHYICTVSCVLDFLDSCCREGCFPEINSRGLSPHQTCFCGHRGSVRKYQVSHCLKFSYGLFIPLNSSELGLEILTLNSKTAWEKFFLKVFVLIKTMLQSFKRPWDALALTPKSIQFRR